MNSLETVPKPVQYIENRSFSTQNLFGNFAFEREPLVALFNLYCDESGKYQKNSSTTFSGVAASKKRLDSFDDEWAVLLRSYEIPELHMSKVLNLPKAHGCKFVIGQSLEDRLGLLKPFADCINRHLEIGFVQAWDVPAYIRIPTEAKKLIGGACDPYYLAFSRGMMEIVKHLAPDDHLSIICDDDLETAWDAYLHYRSLGKSAPEIKKKMVGLTFANSAYFPGLQAADMVAFLSRKEARAQFHNETNEYATLFTYLTTDPRPTIGLMKWFAMFANEQTLVDLANSLSPLKA